ncbi:hypothetical protein ABT147_46260 [Streptomyces sp. NPDC001868]|uniref:hypothetical protein n=1 Tax=Streptomyces sp. NPDC001868 TaxID=3154401 RepID=UPI0033248EA9
MNAAFVWPPRHAPGFPAGCADAGDVLGRIAHEGKAGVIMTVVTSALRASVEESGDHDTGLRRVRESLAALGSGPHGNRWLASYYGKDLVLTSPDATEPPPMRIADGARHGWSWDRVALGGDVAQRRDSLLFACYEVSMAARMRRDRPEIRETQASPVIGGVTRTLGRAEIASLLAGVLVRPLGGADGVLGAALGDDPRLPGVPSADGWTAGGTVAGPTPTGCYMVSDVHDIEWGTMRRIDGARLTEGNARQLLPLAEAWLADQLNAATVLREAYRLRLTRESELLAHLRALSNAVRPTGLLHATLGDGLSGLVPDVATARKAVKAANRRTQGGMHSGAGVAHVTAEGLGIARARSHFSLHVTKTLKGSGHPCGELHEFGKLLDAEGAAYAWDFLITLRQTGTGQPGHHHLQHARRWRDWWAEHVPPCARSDFLNL